MNMKKIHTLTGFCMLAGLSLMIIGFALGGAKHGVYMDLSGIHLGTDESVKITESDLEVFESLDIDVNFSNVKFVDSDKYGMEINYSAKYGKPEWSVSNGLLKIKDSSDLSHSFKFINMGPFFLSDDSRDNYVTIYMPKGKPLKKVTLLVKSGNIDIGGFTADNTDITNYFGDIKLENISSPNFRILLRSGDFKGNGLTSDKLVYENNFGSAVFDGITANSLSASVNSGSFKISNGSITELDVKNNFGDIIVSDSVIKNSNINIDSGDAKLFGDFTGQTTVDSKFGSVKLNLAKEREYYNINLTTNFGDVKIDDDKMGNSAVISEKNSDNLLRVKNQSGDIEVNFGAY